MKKEHLLNFSQLKTIEEERQSKVIVLGAVSLEIDLLPELYESLQEIGYTERLDVLIYCRGGIVNGARRIALLLHEFTSQLSFIVPHYCESSGTMMALSANEIIAGSLAIFSPIDPQLQTSDPSSEGGPLALSSQDIRLFSEMSKDWFGLEEREAKSQSLALLSNSIFPTTLTSFYRSTLELLEIGEELLGLSYPMLEKQQRLAIVNKLLFDYHSHSFALTRNDLEKLGLNVSKHQAVEALAWEVASELRGMIGGGVRQSLDDSWCDTVIAHGQSIKLRYRQPDVPAPLWRQQEIK